MSQAHTGSKLAEAQGEGQQLWLSGELVCQVFQGRRFARARIPQKDDARVFVDPFSQGGESDTLDFPLVRHPCAVFGLGAPAAAPHRAGRPRLVFDRGRCGGLAGQGDVIGGLLGIQPHDSLAVLFLKIRQRLDRLVYSLYGRLSGGLFNRAQLGQGLLQPGQLGCQIAHAWSLQAGLLHDLNDQVASYKRGPLLDGQIPFDAGAAPGIDVFWIRRFLVAHHGSSKTLLGKPLSGAYLL